MNSIGAVLPGKPSPLDYGAVRTKEGKFWWPAPDAKGMILVHGKKMPKKTQIALYKKALKSWKQTNAAYSAQVANAGVDRASRSAIRGLSARIAALENRNAMLEEQLASVNLSADQWDDSSAYYYSAESYEPGGYLDDEGAYGFYDGMSGVYGDDGYVRKYGVHSQDGVSGDEDGREHPEVLSGGEEVEFEGLAAALVPPEHHHHEGDDGIGAAFDPLAFANRQSAARSGKLPPRIVAEEQFARDQAAKSIAAERARQSATRPSPTRPSLTRPSSTTLPRRDSRDTIIADLRNEVRAGRIDVYALADVLKEAGYVIQNETRKKETEIMMRRMGDGVSGADQSESNIAGSVPDMPPPPPPPPIEDLSGSDCGCSAPPGDG